MWKSGSAMHPWQLELICFWKLIFPVMWQDVGEWGEQKLDKNWVLQETWMCYDKPGAITCLLCRAALAQRRGCEGMQCYEAPPVHGGAPLAESCFCPIITLHHCRNSVPVATEKWITIKINKFWGRWPTVHTFSVITCNTGWFKDISPHCFWDMWIYSLQKGFLFCLGE